MINYRIEMLNYQFPQINNISDIICHIDGRDEYKVSVKDWYTVVNYAVAFEDTFKWDDADQIGSKIRRECRGLIFDTETGKIISRPYHKFFNVGEREETAINKVNLYEPHVVLEKLDGSMIRPIPTKEGFRLGTKAGITDVAMNAEVFIADKPEYREFILAMLDGGMTPIFEWCSRKNRIVVDYPDDQLILTGVRNTFKGTYLLHWNLEEFGEHYGIPVVKAVDGLAVQDINLFVKQVREWDDGEGIVLRFDDGHMVKVKADEYVLRHKSKEQISQEKNVLQIIINDSVDDIVPLLTQNDATRLKEFQTAFWASVDDLAYEMAQIYLGGNTVYPDKKDFAVEFVQKKILPIHAPIMYAMKGGKGSRATIVDMISKSLTTQTKIDQNRWLWGGLEWNS
jgi:RNA ligase